MSPRDVIADIRRRYKVDVPHSEDDDPRVGMAGRLLPLVTEELYESRTHFFTELLQNADDNQYGDGLVPCFVLRRFRDSLVIENNESGFEEVHVRAICDAAKSTKANRKKGPDGATGEKGIGFKAVFQVSDRPEVHSNGYHFRFDRNKHGPFGTVIPEWIDGASDSMGTRIVLPLRTDYALPAEFLKSLQPELLLFLRRLKRLEFHDVDYGQAVVLRRSDDGPNVAVTRTVTDSVEKQRSGEQRHSFRVHSLRISMADIHESRRSNIETTDVAIAMPLDADGNVNETQSRSLFAFLPVKDSGLRFLAHADFVLATSRETLREDLPWNQRLRDALGQCLAEAVLACRSGPTPGATALRCLSDPKQIRDPFLCQILEQAIDRLSHEECVPIRGNKWVRPGDAIVTDRRRLWELVPEADAFTLLGKKYVEPSVDRIDLPLGRLNVGKFSLESLLTCLNDAAWRSSRGFHWFGDLLARLGSVRLDDGELESLRRAPILPLESGTIIAPAADTVFRSLGGDTRYGFERELKILAPEVLGSLPKEQEKVATELLHKLGVTDASPSAIIDRHILKIHSSPEWGECDDTLLMGHLVYVRDHLRAYLAAKPNDRREKARLELAQHLKVRSSDAADEPEYGMASAHYLGVAYDDPNGLEALFGELIASERISPAYLSLGVSADVSASKEAWTHLFRELGAQSLPRVYSSDDQLDYEWSPEVTAVFASTDEAKKQRLLTLIDQNWTNRYVGWSVRPRTAPPQPSKLVLSLQATVVPTEAGASALKGTYLPTPDNRAIFGAGVPYLAFNVSAPFAATIGITAAPSVRHALARLDQLRQQAGVVAELLTPLYQFLQLHFDQHVNEIAAAFKSRKLILGDGRDGAAWASAGECCWSVPSDLRKLCPLIGLSTTWRDLQGFFCDKLKIQLSLSADQLVDALAALAKSGMTASHTTALTRSIYRRLRPWAEEAMDEPAASPAWLLRMRSELMLWTKSAAWWRNDNDVFASDDPKVEALFASSGAVAFVDLPPEDLTSHAALLELLDITRLSDAIKVAFPTDATSTPWPGFQERLRERLRVVVRFLHHKHASVLDSAMESGALSSMRVLSAHRCTPLYLKVDLNGEAASHQFGARLIVDGNRTDLFVDATCGDDWDAISIEIGRLLDMPDTDALTIGKLLEKPTLADAERVLLALRVPDLPNDLAAELFGDLAVESEALEHGEHDTDAPPMGENSVTDEAMQEVVPTDDGQVSSGASVDETDTRNESNTSQINRDSQAPAAASSGDGVLTNDLAPEVTESAGRRSSSPASTPAHGAVRPAAGPQQQAIKRDDDDGDDESASHERASSPNELDAEDKDSGNRSISSEEGRDVRERPKAGGPGSHLPNPNAAGSAPTEPDAPGRDRRSASKSGSANERLRSYVHRDADPDDDADDGAAAEERARIGAAAIRHVLKWESDQKRDPTDANEENPQNEGYDVASKGPGGEIERYIEVKGVKGEWGRRGVAVTPSQFTFATTHGHRAWLYIVEFALSDAPRIHRIQDFARRVWRFGFDDGWREVAEAVEQASWPEPTVGMPVSLPDGRSGTVVRVYGAGDNRGVDVSLNAGGPPVRVLWQPARIKPERPSENS